MWGAIISGIISAAGSYYASRKQRKSQESQYEDAKRRQDTEIQRRVRDAKMAGIHPGTALGIPMSSGPSFSVGGEPSYADAGRQIGAAVDKGSDYARAEDLKDLALNDAYLNNSILRQKSTQEQVKTKNMLYDYVNKAGRKGRPLAVDVYDPTSEWQGKWPDPELFEPLERSTSPGMLSIPYFNRDQMLPWEEGPPRK